MAARAASERILTLIREALSSGGSTDSLRALTELRAELDKLELEQVLLARAQGRSFSDLARALQISRQAAHRRYRDLATTRESLRTPQPLTDNARSLLELARDQAAALGAERVTGIHVLLAAVVQSRSGDPASIDAARSCVQPSSLRADPPSEMSLSLQSSLARRPAPVSVRVLLDAALEEPDAQQFAARLSAMHRSASRSSTEAV